MVVIATPTSHPLVTCDPNISAAPTSLTPVTCAGQNVISALIATTNSLPVLTRMRAMQITQGQCATINWQMIDNAGNPVDLTGCLPGVDPDNPLFAFTLRLKEQMSLGNERAVLSVPATISDALTGKVQAQLTPSMVNTPGIYYAEMALTTVPATPTESACVIFSNTFYLVINRSTFGPPSDIGGPPSIAEIRLHLRDSSPAESYLLEHLMFDDAEIALAISRPVMYWNEIPPPLDQIYNTQNFPFRYHWLEGICANLFFMVAEQFRRNQLDYSAGGVAINDQNKEASYERAGQTRWQAYREWVRATKASINLESCYGEVTSTYKYSAYTDAIRIRY
ncbi:hypothetical protein EBZ39_02610 [bacterium]|nr:hypothetical protein [bacterium]